MTEKEIKARYKHAVLGFLWVILNPLLQMLVIGFVFQFFVPIKVDNYFLFLFAGLLPWNFFGLSLTKTVPMYVYERGLIQKAKFPREAIVLSIVLANFFHLLVSLLLLIPITLWLGQLNFVNLIWLPLALCWLLILTAGCSLLFSSLNVRFRDVNFAIQALMPLWFYATPVVYNLALIPSNWQFLFSLNPLMALVELFRFVFLNLSLTSGLFVALSLIMTLVLTTLGIIVFKKLAPTFDDWV